MVMGFMHLRLSLIHGELRTRVEPHGHDCDTGAYWCCLMPALSRVEWCHKQAPSPSVLLLRLHMLLERTQMLTVDKLLRLWSPWAVCTPSVYANTSQCGASLIVNPQPITRRQRRGLR